MKHIIVIGAGPGGYECAIRFRQHQNEVTLIEENCEGGTCLNRGCIPTKALLHASELYSNASELHDWGIESAPVIQDESKIFSKKQEIVDTLKKGISSLISAYKINYIKGHAYIVDSTHVFVNDQTLTADYIIIATGSTPFVPKISGSNLPHVLTSDTLLELNKIPKSMVILGGGVIGTEMASVFSAFGTAVTIVESADRLLPTMDKELSQSVQMHLKKRGVTVRTKCTLQKITQEENTLFCHLLDNETPIQTEYCLISVGRRPNVHNLFAPSFSLQMQENRIQVDAQFKTSDDHIYAIGDVCSKVQLAHVASAQGKFVADTLSGKKSDIQLHIIPLCVYTCPEIASVGLTEQEAKTQDIPVCVSKFLLSSNGRTLIEKGDRGFVKVLYHEHTKAVLGAQILCYRATDMIDEIALAISNQLTLSDCLKTMRPHPSFVEGIMEAIENAEDLSVHVPPKRKI